MRFSNFIVLYVNLHILSKVLTGTLIFSNQRDHLANLQNICRFFLNNLTKKNVLEKYQ